MAAGRSLITIEVQAIAALLILIIGAVVVVPIVFISIVVVGANIIYINGERVAVSE